MIDIVWRLNGLPLRVAANCLSTTVIHSLAIGKAQAQNNSPAEVAGLFFDHIDGGQSRAPPLPLVREGGVVQHDAHLAIIPLLETPGLVYSGLLVIAIYQMHLAHGQRHVAVDIDGCIVIAIALPVFQGKAAIGRIGAVVADKVGPRPLAVGAKGLLATGKGGFKQHWPLLVAIGAVEHRLGGRLGALNPTGTIVIADLDKRRALTILRGLDLRLGNIVVGDFGCVEGAAGGKQDEGKGALLEVQHHCFQTPDSDKRAGSVAKGHERFLN